MRIVRIKGHCFHGKLGHTNLVEQSIDTGSENSIKIPPRQKKTSENT